MMADRRPLARHAHDLWRRRVCILLYVVLCSIMYAIYYAVPSSLCTFLISISAIIVDCNSHTHTHTRTQRLRQRRQ